MGKIISALRIANTALRGSLIFILASILSSEDFGTFSLTASTISYATLFFGFDLYIHTTRIATQKNRSEYLGKTKQQLKIVAIAYTIAIPIFLTTTHGKISPYLQSILIALALTEHANQELYRVLICRGAIGRGTTATFLRSGGWLIVLIPWILSKSTIELIHILHAWLIFSVASILVSIDQENRETALEIFKSSNLPSFPILTSSLKFWTATLALRAGGMLDRWAITMTFGLSESGRYSLFFAISSIFPTLLETLAIEPKLHRLLRANQQHTLYLKSIIYKNSKKAALITGGLAFTLTSIALLTSQNLFKTHNTPSFLELLAYSSLSSMLSIHAIVNASLYTLKEDGSIIRGNFCFAGSLACLLAAGALIDSLALLQMAAPIALLTATLSKSTHLFKNVRPMQT